MIIVWIIIFLIIGSFLFVVFRGAPYVPTHYKWVKKAVAMTPKAGLLVDLGSGDGMILRSAAESGRMAIGVELNPLLVLISKISLLKYQDRASVRLGDYWHFRLPETTSAVFIFTAGPFVEKLHRHLVHEATRLGRSIELVSYGFSLSGAEIIQQDGPLFMQRIYPLQEGKKHLP